MTEREIHEAIKLEAYFIWQKTKKWGLPNADDDKANWRDAETKIRTKVLEDIFSKEVRNRMIGYL